MCATATAKTKSGVLKTINKESSTQSNNGHDK